MLSYSVDKRKSNMKDIIEHTTEVCKYEEKVQETAQIIEMINEIDRYIEMQKGGCYFANKHKIYINHEKYNIINRFIILMHESVHAMLGETSFGFYVGDIAQLLNILLQLLNIKKVEYMTDYCNRIGISQSEQLEYIRTNALEIDVVLSQYSNYVECAKFCSKLYIILRVLHSNSVILNEGCATYISDNFSQKTFNKLFGEFPISKMSRGFRKILYEYQEEEKKSFEHMNCQTYYYEGYKLAEKIYKKYGEDGLLISAIAASNIPFYEYDLFDMELEDLKYALSGLYNCDSRWMKFMELSEDLINNAIRNPDKYLSKVCNQLARENLPNLKYKNNISSLMYTEEATLKFGFLSTSVLEYCNRLDERYVDVFKETIKNTDFSNIKISDFYNYSNYQKAINYIFMEMLGSITDNFENEDLNEFYASKDIFDEDIDIRRSMDAVMCVIYFSNELKNNNIIHQLICSDKKINKEDISLIREYAKWRE